MKRTAFHALFAAALFATAASAETLVAVDTNIGEVIAAGENGMTLYTFAPDSDGRSTCQGSCLQNWPAFTASGDSQAEGEFTVLSRQDAGSQWVYQGKPLYLWVGDRAPGDVTGNGVGGSWQVARP